MVSAIKQEEYYSAGLHLFMDPVFQLFSSSSLCSSRNDKQ